MTQAPVAVGLDLGTSGLKAVALDSAGAVLAAARRSYPTDRPERAAAEQDPQDWWRAVDEALRELDCTVPAASWGCIGLSAMLPTLVAAAADGTPLAPAITWQDGRAEADGEALRTDSGPYHLYVRTGQWVDGRYLLPMMARLVRAEPRARAATHVLGAKDHLFARLTGELLTDPSTAAGYGCFDLRAGTWFGQTQWSLPQVAPATTARPLLAELAERWGAPAGIPVVLGAADSVLGAHALGVREPGEVAYLAGSSTVILGRLGRLRTDAHHRYLVTPTADAGLAAEMDLLATGSAQAWWAEALGLPGPQQLGELAAQARLGAGPVFLPYVAPGEQGALWDPDLTGGLVGLTLRHTRADLARALLTGIVLESARCVAVLAEVARAEGAAPGEIRVGGSAAGVGFAQDLADATGRTVRLDPDGAADSAVGAAMLAAEATGLGDPRPTGSGLTVAPRTGAAEVWRELSGAYEQARRSGAGRVAAVGVAPARAAGDDGRGEGV